MFCDMRAGKKRSRDERSAQRMQRAALQKAQHSQFVKDLQAEVTGAPQEDAAAGAASTRGTDSLALLKQQQRLEARAAIEEDMMVRCCVFLPVPVSACSPPRWRQTESRITHTPGRRTTIRQTLKIFNCLE